MVEEIMTDAGAARTVVFPPSCTPGSTPPDTTCADAGPKTIELSATCKTIVPPPNGDPPNAGAPKLPAASSGSLVAATAGVIAREPSRTAGAVDVVDAEATAGATTIPLPNTVGGNAVVTTEAIAEARTVEPYRTTGAIAALLVDAATGTSKSEPRRTAGAVAVELLTTATGADNVDPYRIIGATAAVTPLAVAAKIREPCTTV